MQFWLKSVEGYPRFGQIFSKQLKRIVFQSFIDLQKSAKMFLLSGPGQTRRIAEKITSKTKWICVKKQKYLRIINGLKDRDNSDGSERQAVYTWPQESTDGSTIVFSTVTRTTFQISYNKRESNIQLFLISIIEWRTQNTYVTVFLR